ncbi:unnamed protein product [Heterobilharzia americana]|nr:unnamed protein product [Heterobilharzia americana]CAH8546182.1 unnamed protein product [Heterobilharzia americana]CAH8546197.1 unnamed protein product [Heterobilharzia americana]
MISTKGVLNLFRTVFYPAHSQVIFNSTIIPDLVEKQKTLKDAAESSPGLNIVGHNIVTEDCLTSVVENKQYYETPILHLSMRKNNLVATLTDCNGRVLDSTSCGAEGFHNARKKSTVAVQTVGISIGLKAKKLGISAIRIVISGQTKSKLAVLSGLNISGMQIISLTDDTELHYGHGRRPRKPPRK